MCVEQPAPPLPHRIWEDDGAEGEGVRADGGHENRGDVGVHHGTPRGDRVRGGTRGGGEHHAVCLYGGDELPPVVRLNL